VKTGLVNATGRVIGANWWWWNYLDCTNRENLFGETPCNTTLHKIIQCVLMATNTLHKNQLPPSL